MLIDGTFDGVTVVVTGAARGLGREYTAMFAADGARVALLDLDGPGAVAAAAELRSCGHKAVGYQVDVACPTGLQAVAERVAEELGPTSVLVNNAAIWGDLRRGPLVEIEPSYFDLVMAVNLKGPLMATRAFLPQMRGTRRGRVVNVSSMGAYMAAGVYGVSKLALNQLTYALATELGGEGITVNAVAPGAIDNDATRSQMSETAFDRLVTGAAIQRPGTAADVYSMIRYLASDEAAWVTGQTFLVNGGFSTRL